MTPQAPQRDGALFLEPSQIDHLIRVLGACGHEVVGPTIRDGAIVYDRVVSLADLPVGWTDRQEGGSYRLARRSDDALFGYRVGPYSWKKFLFPPSACLWRARRTDGLFEIVPVEPQTAKLVFLGVRACELAALRITDQVFLKGPYVDPHYRARREGVFVVAVNCTEAGATCFCDSMGTGPEVSWPYDLLLTEILRPGRHGLVVQIGSDAGREVLSEVSHTIAGEAELAAAREAVREARSHMGRHLDTGGLKELLYRNSDCARWDAVAERCLSCANCTMVCPTCFCSTVEDRTDLGGREAERLRRWDSCYTSDFSYLHGGSVRVGTRSKYRQWMMHKLAYWYDQFGTSGCVGCGRCITWCPVGIDLTEEARAIREQERSAPGVAEERRT